jgi:hypothetical protein
VVGGSAEQASHVIVRAISIGLARSVSSLHASRMSQMSGTPVLMLILLSIPLFSVSMQRVLS